MPAFPSRDAVFRRLLVLADVLGAAAALLFAVSVIGSGLASIRPTALVMVPFIVLVSKAIGLYDRDQHTLRKSTIDELPIDPLPLRCLRVGSVAG